MPDVTEKIESTVPPKTLGERVKVARLAANLSAKKLEEQAGLSPGIVSRIESGERGKRLSGATIEKLAAALGVSSSYITTGTELPEGARAGIRTAASPPLESLPGYSDAEVVVARLEPDVPLEIFRQARQARFALPPERVTPAYLRALVRFLSGDEWVDETQGISEKIAKKNRKP